jgi:hypothetical protein
VKGGAAFGRARALMAAINAVIMTHAANPLLAQAELARLKPYEGRGKGKTRWHHAGGHLAQRRAALKKRNQARNRRAHRG